MDLVSLLGLLVATGDAGAAALSSTLESKRFRRDLADALYEALPSPGTTQKSEIREHLHSIEFWTSEEFRSKCFEQWGFDQLLEVDHLIASEAMRHTRGRSVMSLSVALSTREALNHVTHIALDNNAILDRMSRVVSVADQQVARVSAELRLLGDHIDDARAHAQSDGRFPLTFFDTRREITVLMELSRVSFVSWVPLIEELYGRFNDFIAACERGDVRDATALIEANYLWFLENFVGIRHPTIEPMDPAPLEVEGEHDP